jgi:hypothetical protein
VVSSVVGPWDTMADDMPYAGGSTACLVASADSVPQYLLKLCALFGPQQRLAGGHRHLLVVKVGHLVHLPMYLFVAAKRV